MATTSSAAADTQGGALFGMYLLALGAALAGNVLIRVGIEGGWLPPGASVGIAVLSIAPLASAAVFFWRVLRRDLDEMIQRIVLEAMAFALIVHIPLAALYVNLKVTGVWVPRLDAPDLLMAPALLVAIGVVFISRRYQ